MNNYHLASSPIVERLYLVPIYDDFIPNSKDISTYKKFTKSVQ